VTMTDRRANSRDYCSHEEGGVRPAGQDCRFSA
jgi:hypothetical protein